MPSFKERFRPSRKYKKNKEAGAAGTDEAATVAVATGTSTNTNNVPIIGTLPSTTVSTTSAAAAAAAASTTTTTSTTIDEHTGSAALSTYHSYHLNDQCE